jgi:Tol biopolymer transport system component
VKEGHDAFGVVMVGGRDGDVDRRELLGRRWVELPTWSPDGRRIAFIVRGTGREGHRTASLHVYDVDTRVDYEIARNVSDAFWAAWSRRALAAPG